MSDKTTTISINGGPEIPYERFSEIANERSRNGHIIDTTLDLIREAIADKIDAVEEAAAEAAGDTDSDKPVIAKLGISVKWEAGKPEPEITVKASYTVTRSVEVSAKADGDQSKLPLE
jgi:hypothetical protein